VLRRTLTEDEMVEILEDIARESGNAAARIAAIKTLREMANGEQPTEGGFDALDDELASRRHGRTKTTKTA
jgi:hypothetical protein